MKLNFSGMKSKNRLMYVQVRVAVNVRHNSRLSLLGHQMLNMYQVSLNTVHEVRPIQEVHPLNCLMGLKVKTI